jgi:hypothetical protein
MAKMRKKAAIANALKAKGLKPNGEAQAEARAWYAAGYCTGWITAFARGAGIDEHDLAGRVGQILLARSRRESLGA